MNQVKSQPTYKRQRYLLSIVRRENSNLTTTELQSMAFVQKVTCNMDFYEFVPSINGAYSYQISEDLDILQRHGFITLDCTESGTKITAVEDIHYGDDDTYIQTLEQSTSLMRRVYREYPYYLINCDTNSLLIQNEDFEKINQKKQSYIQNNQVLFTIGYEGICIETFINQLIQNDVRLICDVRKNPLSRKFGFSKRKLDYITETVGIRYVHIPELGIESDKRRSLETLNDYQRLFADYSQMLDCRTSFLDKAISLLHENTRIALMCLEKSPEMCHRHVIRDYMVEKTNVRSIDI